MYMWVCPEQFEIVAERNFCSLFKWNKSEYNLSDNLLKAVERSSRNYYVLFWLLFHFTGYWRIIMTKTITNGYAKLSNPAIIVKIMSK